MPGRRVVVMSPQTRHAHSGRRLRGRWRVPKLDAVDAERAQRLYLAQRKRAAAPLIIMFAGMFGLPALFALFPGLDDARWGGIPLSWIVIVVLPYPGLVLLARWQLKRAERVEEDGGPAPRRRRWQSLAPAESGAGVPLWRRRARRERVTRGGGSAEMAAADSAPSRRERGLAESRDER
jgi:hypothetical protein